MPVRNHLLRLVQEKLNREGVELNYKEISEQTGLSYQTVTSWLKGHVNRADFPILEVWCKYLNCQVGDILTYEDD